MNFCSIWRILCIPAASHLGFRDSNGKRFIQSVLLVRIRESVRGASDPDGQTHNASDLRSRRRADKCILR